MEALEVIQSLERLTHRAELISRSTHKRETSRWEVMIVTLLFARLTLNGITVLRLSPGSSFCSAVNGMQIWDLSSIGSLSRNLMETYLTLRYMLEPMTLLPEDVLRRKIWEYHEASERYKMMKHALPFALSLTKLNADRKERQVAIQNDEFFQKLDEKKRRLITNGDIFRLRTAEELCHGAGVSLGYYKAMFKFGSNHTHSSPYSTSLLNIDGPMTPEAQCLLRVSLQASTGFVAMAIRDFIGIFPDQLKDISAEELRLIRKWEGILKWDIDPSSHQREQA